MKTTAYKPTTIDEYISDFPSNVQERLRRVRATIRKAAPQSEEAIKYAIPTFILNGNLIHFAGYQNHIGLYPGSRPIAEFKDELAKYHTSKGTVQFPHNKALPLALIGRITRFCVERNLAKKTKTAKK